MVKAERKFPKKCGSVLDYFSLFVISIVIFIVLLGSVIGYMVTKDAFDNTQVALPEYNEQKEVFTDVAEKAPAFLDFVFILFIFLMWIAMLALAFLLDNKPAFLIIYLAIALPLLFGSIFVANAISDFAANPEISSYISTMPMSKFVMVDHMLLFEVLFLVTFGIFLYLKPPGGETPI